VGVSPACLTWPRAQAGAVGVAAVAAGAVGAVGAVGAAGVVARVEAPAPVAAPKRMSIAAALRPPSV
jgi:hypothetical protein